MSVNEVEMVTVIRLRNTSSTKQFALMYIDGSPNDGLIFLFQTRKYMNGEKENKKITPFPL